MPPSTGSTFLSKPFKWLPKLGFPRPRHLKTCPPTTLFGSSLPAAGESTNGGGGSGKTNGLFQVFCRFDADGDGRISGEELLSALTSAGEEVSAEEVERAVGDLDSDGDGLLDYGDFLRLMEEEEEGCGRGDDSDLRAAFEAFETEKGAGCITPAGLGRALGRLGEARTYEECAAMIRAYDVDGNGVLDFQEFCRMMMA